ncbi:MAG: beta-galactosidase [Planctomycetes bacterium]|nr:beta-galactosidase [Planctomycetota bacterium]
MSSISIFCVLATSVHCAVFGFGAEELPAKPAAKLTLEKAALARSDKIKGKFELAAPAAANGTLVLTWTDCFGRTVAKSEQAVNAGAAEASFEISAAPALGLANTLTAELTLGEAKTSAAAEFVVTPDYEPWDDYQVIMYYAYKPEQQAHLRDIGITAGMNQSRSNFEPSSRSTKVWWGAGYRYYCEQILSSVYAEYHRYHGKEPKNIELVKAKELYKQDRTKKDAFIRKPCFHDPATRKKIEDDLAQVVSIGQKFAPLFYSLADEAGVADLPTAWDFCYDPRTLAAMREWLKGQYGTLEALNTEWETKFEKWDDVTPLTTDETMKRGGDNLSPWADHRTFMEITFAEAVKWGSDAVLKADPKAYVGLVGCQMPSAFGGYDYWRLAQAMSCIEPYNIGNNREIWRSFSPRSPAVTTSFGFSNQEVWRLWYQLLHGDRGIIIYDEKNTYLDEKGEPTELGKKVSGPYHELTGGICKLLANCERVNDPIAIHYSQASIHAHWIFQARPEGEKWLERGSASERLKSEFLRLRESFTKLIEDQQLQYTFVSYAQLEQGELKKNPPKILFLPQSIAMSKAECDALRAYVEAGGVLVADSRCALMDEHCKRLEKGQLDDLFGITRKDQEWKPGTAEWLKNAAPFAEKKPEIKSSVPESGIALDAASGAAADFADEVGTPVLIHRQVGKGKTLYLNIDFTDYHRWRLKTPQEKNALALFEKLTVETGVTPAFIVRRPDQSEVPGIELFPFTNGEMKLVALHRNPQLRINELGPPEYRSNEAFEKEEELEVDLRAPYAVYDVRAGKLLAEKEQKLKLKLDPFVPTILALFKAPAKAVSLDVPAKAKRGEALACKIALDAPAPADVHAYRFEVTGPDGKPLPLYAKNLKAPKGACATTLYLALSDPAGKYTVTVRDIATGLSAQKMVEAE